MFAERLTPLQRQATFDLAVMLAAADGEISKEEIEYLKLFSEAFNIEFKIEPMPDDKMDELIKVFDSRTSCVILLQELIKISYKDGHFVSQEQEKVYKIAKKLSLNSPELIMHIEKWVREGFNWLHEGEELLER